MPLNLPKMVFNSPGVREKNRKARIEASAEVLDSGSKLSAVNKNAQTIENRIKAAEQRRESMQPHKRQINPLFAP